MREEGFIVEKLAEAVHSIFFEVFHVDILRDETGQRVNDRAVTDFLLELRVVRVPLVAVDFKEGLHQKLGPNLVWVARSGEERLRAAVARDAIINLY